MMDQTHRPEHKTINEATEPPAPRRKRLKIGVACDLCRTRKVKCDGVRPTCGNCTKRSRSVVACHYSSSNANPNPDTTQNSAFSTGGQVYTGSDRTPISSHDDSLEGSFMNSEAGIHHYHLPTTAVVASRPLRARESIACTLSPGSQTTTPPTTRTEVDSMTTIVKDGESTQEYFGSSSAGSFTSQIRAAIDVRLGLTTPRETNTTFNQTIVTTNHGTVGLSLPRAGEVDYVLPPRRQADHLLEIYWRYVDPLYPFLDRENFESSYRSIFDGTLEHADERTFMATLNVTLAVSTQLQETLSSDHREQACKTFIDRAQSLLRLDIWDTGSIELIQYLLLLSQYLQSTNAPHQTWMVVGTAVRIAQGLGLHLPETSTAPTNTKVRELLRRLWHGCVLMDRMISVTHGRPTMISSHFASAVPVPEQSKRLVFFVNSLRLYEIINQIILKLYSMDSTCKDGKAPSKSCSRSMIDDLVTTLKLDDSLNRMEKDFPFHLKLASLKVSDDPISHRQAVIIHIRFLHTRVLLHRPILAKFCLSHCNREKSSAEETLGDRMIEQCAIECVTSAQKLISIIGDYQGGENSIGLLPAWWYRIFYVYTAATVLLAARLRRERFTHSSISEPWNQAISILQSHEKFGVSARRCVAALQILSSKVLHGSNDTGNSCMKGEQLNQTFSPSEAFDLNSEEPLNGLGFDVNNFEFDVDNYQWLSSMPDGVLY